MASEKSTLFGTEIVNYFQVTCVHICISRNANDTPYTSHMSDFLLMLSLLYCWLFGVLLFGKGGG